MRIDLFFFFDTPLRRIGAFSSLLQAVVAFSSVARSAPPTPSCLRGEASPFLFLQRMISDLVVDRVFSLLSSSGFFLLTARV